MAEKSTKPRVHRRPKKIDPGLNPDFSNIPKEPEQPSHSERFLHVGWEVIKTVGFIFIAAFIIRAWLIQPFIVQGESMEPDFHEGDYLLVDQVSYRFGEPSRGDVVVFKAPPDPSENYIKRVIGLPGETIQLRQGKIFVTNSTHPNGLELKEPYILPGSTTLPESGETTWHLGKNEYFVLGDNRAPDKSSDSRAWGSVPKDNLIGKTWLRAYPVSDFGTIKHQSFGDLSLMWSTRL